MLATYFPKPLNPHMGNWALDQAQAIRRCGIDIQVVSFTAWVPRWVARSKGARAYALCPPESAWADLQVHYPRWPVYPMAPFRPWRERNPLFELELGWRSSRAWLLSFIRAFQPDVVYAHHSAVNGFLAARLKQECGLPFVVTDHDFGEISLCREAPQRKRLFQQVVDSAFATVSVASRMEREVRELFPSANALTVHNGSNSIPAFFHDIPRPPEIQDRQVLFSCGAFYERKGFPFLIDTFARVAKHHPRAVLRIAGDGPERELIARRIQSHGLSDRITLLGRIPHERVLQEMVWSDAFVLLGWDEPFATVYSEAMSAGKPIVCCNDGGFNDVFVDGVHGFALPPRDQGASAAAISALLADPDRTARMGRACRELFEGKLHWNHNAMRMIELFEEAVTAAIPARGI